MDIIKIENLNLVYETEKVIENLSLKLKKGEFCVVSGPNGAGKSTLLKSILKFIEPDSGRIYIENEDVLNIKQTEIAKKIAYVSQNINSDVEFNVYDVISMGRYPYRKDFFTLSGEDKNIIEKYMKLTNSWELKDKSFSKLSSGEKQRVIITRALVQNTDIIILDEPLSNLDMYYKIEFMDMLDYLNKQYNKTILLVLHDINMILQYADRVILLKKGKIFYDGDTKLILQNKVLENLYKIKFDSVKIENKEYIFTKKQQFYFEERREKNENRNRENKRNT
jgi:iron complex transport system ATP-binding protein